MDGFAFDRLVASLTAAGSRRRALGGLLAGALGLLGSRTDDVAAKKKKPCPPCKKRKQGKCRGKQRAGTPCTGGTCDGNGSCIPTGCVPEPVTTTCTVGCGDQLNNCNQSITCPCPRGQTCLPNGTCARPCTTNGGTECADCPGSTCGNTIATTPGAPRYCVVGSTSSDCQSGNPCVLGAPMGCPHGSVCTQCGIPGPRCVGVAACPDSCAAAPRTCPDGRCGSCCGDSDCRGGQQCRNQSGVNACQCPSGQRLCREVCIPSSCAASCDQPCAAGAEQGTPCCVTGSMTCQPIIDGSLRCRP